MLPRGDTEPKGVLCSILRCLAANPHIADRAPKFEDARKFKISTIFRGQNVERSPNTPRH